MADASQTNTGSTAQSNEASVPVDGKGWVDLLAQRQSQITSDITELASRTSMTQQLQNAIDAMNVISLNVMLHIRTATFDDTTGTVSTDTSTASASPTQKGSGDAAGTTPNDNNGSSNTGT